MKNYEKSPFADSSRCCCYRPNNFPFAFPPSRAILFVFAFYDFK